MSTWLIVRVPDQVHCWDLGEPAGNDELERLTAAARVSVNFPAHDQWAFDGSPWTVQVTFGEPHHTLLAQAVRHDVAELAGVDITEHQAARVRAARQDRLDAAAAALAQLDPDELVEVLARRRPP